MQRNIYFDVLDTARTARVGGAEDIRRANECTSRGEAELKMSILCGWTPVFPQTYGWDSAALLGYGAEESFEGASFRWLVEKGLIRIRLRNQASIWDAALAAFESPAYRHLGAWPEFNTDRPQEDRKPLVEAMRTGKSPAALPDEVRNRLYLLRQLSDAAKQAPSDEAELPRGDRLSKLVKEAARVAEQIDPTVANLLWRCANPSEVSDPNNRTAIDVFLDAEKHRGVDVPPEVREITNGCLNVVSAECVRANSVLTMPLSSPKALKVLLQVLPDSRQSDLLEAPIQKLTDVKELQTVNWGTIVEFLQKSGTFSTLGEKIKEAEAAKLIGRVAAEKVPRYAMLTKWSNVLYNTAIWGTSGAVGFAVGQAPGAIAAVTVASALAGGFGSFDIRSNLKDSIAASLEKKWLGLLQAREIHLQR
jgi:hypothetical protein